MLTSDFVTAGRAIFTVEPTQVFIDANARKGKKVQPHYTFRVNHKPASEKGGECYFVALLTGQDNENDYTYLGLLVDQGEVKLTKGSRYADDSFPVRIIRRVLFRLFRDEAALIESKGWKVHHEGRCGRCGRTLTVPESIESGIGPECARKMAG
jgi:hypothetical protein